MRQVREVSEGDGGTGHTNGVAAEQGGEGRGNRGVQVGALQLEVGQQPCPCASGRAEEGRGRGVGGERGGFKNHGMAASPSLMPSSLCRHILATGIFGIRSLECLVVAVTHSLPPTRLSPTACHPLGCRAAAHSAVHPSCPEQCMPPSPLLPLEMPPSPPSPQVLWPSSFILHRRLIGHPWCSTDRPTD